MSEKTAKDRTRSERVRRRRTKVVCLLVKGKVDTGVNSFLGLIIWASALRFGETRAGKIAALGFYRICGRASSSGGADGPHKKGTLKKRVCAAVNVPLP